MLARCSDIRELTQRTSASTARSSWSFSPPASVIGLRACLLIGILYAPTTRAADALAELLAVGEGPTTAALSVESGLDPHLRFRLPNKTGIATAGERALSELVRWGSPVYISSGPVAILSDGSQLSLDRVSLTDGAWTIALAELTDVPLPQQLLYALVWSENAQSVTLARGTQLLASEAAAQFDQTLAPSLLRPKGEEGASDPVALPGKLILRGGESVSSVLESVDNDALQVVVSGTRNYFPLQQVSAWRRDFPARQAPGKAPALGLQTSPKLGKFLVGLKSGSLLSVETLTPAAQGRLHLLLACGWTLEVPWEELVYVQVRAGQRLSYIAQISPTEARQFPAWGEPWNPGQGTTSSNEIPQVAGQANPWGLVMHPPVRAVYRVPADAVAFAAQVAWQDRPPAAVGPFGNLPASTLLTGGQGPSATFKVYLTPPSTKTNDPARSAAAPPSWKLAATAGPLIPGQRALPMQVPLRGEGWLALVVETELISSLSAQVVWLDARFEHLAATPGQALPAVPSLE